MAWKPRRHDEPTIDPFNAPDPIMPSEEPATVDEAGKNDRVGARGDRHTWHRDETPPGHDAPESPAQASGSKATLRNSKRVHRPAPSGQAPKRTGCAVRILVIIVVFTVIVNLIGFAFDSLSSVIVRATQEDQAHDELTFSPLDGPDIADTEDDLESTIETLGSELVTGRLANAANDEQIIALATDSFRDSFEYYMGITPEAVGIDAASVAARALQSVSPHECSTYGYAYDRDDGYELECNVYCSVLVPDLDDVAYNLYWDAPRDIRTELDETGTLSAENAEMLATLLEEELAEAIDDPDDLSISVTLYGAADASGENISLELDGEEWTNELEWLFG